MKCYLLLIHFIRVSWFVYFWGSFVSRSNQFTFGSYAGNFSLTGANGYANSGDSFRLWFVYLEYPIFGRGVRLAHGNGGGLFAVATRYGDGYVACSFRSGLLIIYLLGLHVEVGCILAMALELFLFLILEGKANLLVVFAYKKL